MALPIITAIRACYDLKESLLHTAEELAHRASIYGVVRVSLRYLAEKCHCTKQTIINHLKVLIERGILGKTRQRKQGNLYYEINSYTFKIPWHKDSAKIPSQNFGQKLSHQEERGKFGTIEEDIATLKKGLRMCTEGTEAYQETFAAIQRLTALREGVP